MDRDKMFDVTRNWIFKKYSAYKSRFKQSQLALLRQLTGLKSHTRRYLECFQDYPQGSINMDDFVLPRVQLIEKMFLRRYQEYKKYSHEETRALYKDMSLICYQLLDKILEDISNILKDTKTGQYYFEDRNIVMTVDIDNVKIDKLDSPPINAIVIDRNNKLGKPESKIIDREVAQHEIMRSAMRKMFKPPNQVLAEKRQLDQKRLQHQVKQNLGIQ